MFRIACLHTADSNINVFEAAAPGLPVVLAHAVRADLLAAAEAAGGMDAGTADATRGELAALACIADVVVLTCSTLGPSVDAMTHGAGRIIRADAALARQVAAAARPAVVLCAAPTTLAATTDLFHAAAVSGPKPVVRLVDGAWTLFRSGDVDAYLDMLAAAVDQAFAEGVGTVALAQASMAGAVTRCRRGRPLTVPRAALEQAVSLAAG
ncbi:MAG: Asp/Glu racemase [Pseudomonadota bacterium]|nr:Asp/Glu racemase [Pseudomonadota bacterium]